MNDKGNMLFGDEGILKVVIVMAVLIIVGGGVVLMLGSGSEGFANKLKLFLPGFNNSIQIEDEGELRLLYKISDGGLYYHDGANLKEIKNDIKINKIEVNRAETIRIFEDYYYGTERSNFRTVRLEGELAFFEGDITRFCKDKNQEMCGGFKSNENLGNGFIFINLFRGSERNVIEDNGGFLYLSNGKLLYREVGKGEYRDVTKTREYNVDENKVIQSSQFWRNQILENGVCEKFIRLLDKEYSVKANGDFLVVKVDSLVEGEEKYNDCSGEENNILMTNDYRIQIVFSTKNENRYTWYGSIMDGEWIILDEDKRFDFPLNDPRKKDLYDGLEYIADRLSESYDGYLWGALGGSSPSSIIVLLIGPEESININEILKKEGILTSDGKLEDETRFVRKILSEYKSREVPIEESYYSSK